MAAASRYYVLRAKVVARLNRRRPEHPWTELSQETWNQIPDVNRTLNV